MMKKNIIFWGFVLSVLLFVSSIVVPLQAAIPASERAALIALYNATNGDSWDINSGWKTPPLHTDGFAMPGTEDTWGRITVTSVSGDHVTEINLCHNNLNGSIPPELGNLSNLEVLDLYANLNMLTGSIPPELGNLSNLTVLSLAYNQLSGSIPSELGNLSNLKYLTLYYNQLSGSIPPELGNLSNLILLSLQSNQLSGSIPPELGNLSNLKELGLHVNQLRGSIPLELGNLNNLGILWLHSNKLIGSIPVELGNLSSLYHAEIGYNGLYTNYDILRDFLNSKDPDWEATQTIAPTNVSAAATSTSSINVSWTPITYTGDTGSYKVYYSTTSGGPWTYAGMTADKSTASCDVMGLSPGTTYYFVIKTLTNPHGNNSNKVVSEYSEETSATTSGVAAYLLTVQSSPDTGVRITVSPDDNSGSGDGNTNFTRTYNSGTEVTLTAPATYNGKNFSNWNIDGVDNTSRNIQVIMNSNHTVQAVYESLTYNLTVQSSPDIGVSITVTPNDNSGNGDGSTNFTRTYNMGTDVTLTAPTTHNGKNFFKWVIDGVDNTSQTIQVTMNRNHTVTAIYEEGTATYTLNVQSTLDTGVNITVTPDDNSGSGNGATNFTRTYNEGTAVTLTAPSIFNGKEFSKWTIDVDGTDNTNLSIQVTMNSNHMVTAYYETPIPSVIALNRTKQNFGYIKDGHVTGPQTLIITCGGTLNWTAAVDVSWLNVSPSSGTGYGEVEVSINTLTSGLSAGNYTGTVSVSAPNAVNSPKIMTVLLKVYAPGTSTEPFGEYVSPVDGSTVCSSIPVTGWILDDIGIESVKIYREEGVSLVYIGDALFVEGARPDLEQAYPDYPMNYQAGWGYMMLTNFLPNGGNGTFNIHAIAASTEGQQITLGIKTIKCDNANAIKPFGAIDTPAQGGTASASSFINWGWVLTPQPNSIPKDGSTINVFVDGVNLGHPFYNIYRSDIAGLFPNYSNISGAGGYFYLDTTTYEYGVHTIHWTAEDNAGNSDGIGSRYFSIKNSGVSGQLFVVRTQDSVVSGRWPVVSGELFQIPIDYSKPVGVQKGYNKRDILPEIVYPDDNGIITVEIRELERLKIRLFPMGDSEETRLAPLLSALLGCTGHQVVGTQLRPLPIGSTFDAQKGVFYWQPGPGFIGEYRLVFIVKEPDQVMIRKNVDVNIIPRFVK